MACIVDWEAAAALGPAAVGGKGWNLGRLYRYGFAVPGGGVVVAEAYRAFLRENGLEPRVVALSALRAEEVGDPAVARGLADVAEAIRLGRLPKALAADLEAFLASRGLVGRPVAVRSSATAEDSTAASFAGIHRSFLNVTSPQAVAEALKGCYASLWTPQAVAYRRRQGLSDPEVAAAVVILEMVPAQAAGVAFSADPRTGNRDRMAISVALGLGDLLVSGAVEPDEYQVDMLNHPPLIAERRIGNKEKIARPRPGGGTEQIDTPLEERRQPALTDAQVQQLASLVLRVQDALGEDDMPQDVEWAWDGEQFVLLQARPITHLPEPGFPALAGQPVIWSNANLKEVLPGVLSLFSWTTVRSIIDALLSTSFRVACYPLPPGLRWIRLYQGQAYFNLSAMQWGYYDAAGTMPEELNRLLGGHQPTISGVPTGSPFRGLTGLRRLARLLRLAIRTLRAIRRAPDDFRRHWEWSEAQEARAFTRLTYREMIEFLRELRGRLDGFLPQVGLINGSAGGSYQQLERILERHFPGRGTALANGFLAGSDGVTSAEQGYRLMELGRIAREEAPARAFFAMADFDPSSWRQALAGTDFRAEFERFLMEYGHRGIYEGEISNPRWREDPTYLLEIIRSQVRSDPIVRPQPPEEKRRAAEAELGALGRLRRWSIRAMANRTREAARLREMAKSMMIKLGGTSRVLILEVGRRLAAEGRLEAPEDIFFASWADVEGILTGAWDGRGLRALVMEVGGYLSHGAIVAREYGIPAVVNIPGVLGAVADGQPLTVDGDAGKVYKGRTN